MVNELGRLGARRVLVTPTAPTAPHRIHLPGVAVRTIRGAAPGTFVTFGGEAAGTIEDRQELSNGSWLVRPFDDLAVHFPSADISQRLELEIWQCASLAVAPIEREGTFQRFGLLVRAFDVAVTEPVNEIVIENPRGPLLDGRHDQYTLTGGGGAPLDGVLAADFRPFDLPFGWIDGAVTGSGPYTVALYHWLDQAQTRRALIGSITHPAPANAITGTWDIALGTGITPAWSAGRSPGMVPLGPLGCSLEIRVLAPVTLSFAFWLRSSQ